MLGWRSAESHMQAILIRILLYPVSVGPSSESIIVWRKRRESVSTCKRVLAIRNLAGDGVLNLTRLTTSVAHHVLFL